MSYPGPEQWMVENDNNGENEMMSLTPEAQTPQERQSIQPTYDHAETGDRFSVETRVAGRRISLTPTVDPFISHRVTIGWPDLLRGILRRRLEIEVLVSGDQEIVEDVSELNSDYLGEQRSSRRREWNEQLERGLGDFASRLAEHDV